LWTRLAGLFRAKWGDQDFAAELESHLQLHIEDNVRRGLTPAEARREALVKLGGVAALKEAHREQRGVPWLETLAQDVRFGLRQLRKSPGLACRAALMLGLGIGASTTVFCWIQAIVLQPLPGVADAGRLLVVAPGFRGELPSSRVSYPEFQSLGTLEQVFSGVAGSSFANVLLRVNAENEWVHARVASAGAFEVLGVRPAAGRLFLPEEDRDEGGHAVLVISYEFWRRKFLLAPDIAGRTVEINGHLFSIIGVTAEGFEGVSGGMPTDVWAPLSMHDAILNYGSYTSRTFRWIQVLARRRPGVSLETARAALEAISAQMAQQDPESNQDVQMRAFRLWESPFGGQAAFLPVLRILFAVSLAILLIVSVNVSCLLLARGVRREREIAVRVAMGARRTRLARQFLTESLLLALAGTGVAVLFARAAIRLFAALAPPGALPLEYHFRVGGSAFLVSGLLALLATVLSGLAPALRLSRVNLLESLKAAARGAGMGLRHHRLLNGLVIAEVALALLLVIGAGLCRKGFERLKQMDLGFDPHNVLFADLTLVANGYTAKSGKIFDRELRQRVAALPGVVEAAQVNTPPLGASGTFTALVEVDGRDAASREDRLVSFVITSPAYLRLMRIPLLDGRDFTDADDASRPNVAIVSEAMARRYWPQQNPIGRTFRMAAGIAASDSFQVVGTAGDAKYDSVSEPPPPLVYLSYQQRPIASLFMGLLVRTRGGPGNIATLLRREIHALDPAVEPQRIETLEEYMQPSFLPARTAEIFLAILGVAALALAASGLHAVMSYAVNQRWHEFGVRMALGAQPGGLARLTMGHGLILAGAGTAAGWAAALALSRLLGRFLYGLSAADPGTYLTAAALLILTAALACYLPARRAMRTDPAVVLRND
jgi:predicted permease